ncbi:MAG: hypothetical protein ABIR62_09470 [Dokdonella sp.]
MEMTLIALVIVGAIVFFRLRAADPASRRRRSGRSTAGDDGGAVDWSSDTPSHNTYSTSHMESSSDGACLSDGGNSCDGGGGDGGSD